MGDAALDLPLAQERVQHGADIVDRDVAGEPHLAGLSIDLDLGKVRAAGKGRRTVRAEIGPLGEPGLDLVGQLRGMKRMPGDLGDVDRAVGAGDDELAALKDDIVARRLHHVGGDATTLVDKLVGRHDDRRAGELRRARAEGADPHGHEIAVAKAVADLIGIDAEFLRQHLLEGRAVTLAVIHAAGNQDDAARRIEADLGMLVIAPAGRRDRRRDADAEKLAAAARLGTALLDAVIGGEMQRVIEVLCEIAAVIGLA